MNHAPTVNNNGDGEYELTAEDEAVEALRSASQNQLAQQAAVAGQPEPPPSQADMDDEQALNDFEERYRKPSHHVIEGWQNKKFSDSAAISSMTPFIKLYCIYSSEELQLYENVLANNKWMREQPDQWLESGREIFDPKLPDGFVDSLYSAFQIEFAEGGDQGSKRVINSIISKSEEGGGIYATDMTFAIPQGPDNNWDGGFGVIDMQSTKMTDTPFVENFSMKIQLNNPRLIKQKYEFNKLITVGSHFLIMYGWSDGSETGLYDAENKKIFLDTNDAGFYNRGNWRWTVVQLHKFNFNFNSMGQMEGTLDFISAQNSDIIFNMNSKMSNISQYSMYFLNSRFLGGVAQLERAEATVGTFDDQGNELDYEITQESTLLQALVAQSVGAIDLSGLDSTEDTTQYSGDANTAWEKLPKKPPTFVQSLKAMSGYYGEVIIYLPRRLSKNGKEVADMQIAGWWVKDKGFIMSQWFNSLSDGPASLPGAGNGDLAPSKAAAMSYTGSAGRTGSESGYYLGIITGRGEAAPPALGEGSEIPGGIIYQLDLGVNNSRVGRLGGGLAKYAQGGSGADTAETSSFNLTDMLNDNLLFQGNRIKFAGHELWDEINPLLTCSQTDKDTIKNMSEGISVTTMSLPTILDDKGREQVEGKIIGEDILYYNLGWVITSLIYYNYKLGSGSLDIRYGNLSPQLRVNDNFRYSSTNYVRNIYAENNKENSYDPENFTSLIKASESPSLTISDISRRTGRARNYDDFLTDALTMTEVLKTVERIEPWMVNEFEGIRAPEDDWVRLTQSDGLSLRGLYYNELLSYFSGADLISAENTTTRIWGTPDSNGIQKLEIDKLGWPVNRSGFDNNAYNNVIKNLTPEAVALWDPDASRVVILRKGNDLFFSQGVVIPFLEPLGKDGQGTVDRVALTGVENIDRIVKIPMEANRVDEVFSNAIGTAQSPADIINKILTDCCSIDGLGLGVITKSNGSLVIEAAGGMKVETEQFNMDYSEEELTEISEGNNFVLDYRSKNSLIKNLTVGGSMDPNISFLYGNSIRQQNSKATILSAINQRSRTNPNDITFTEFAKNWLFKNQERGDASQIAAALRTAESKINNIQNGVIDDPDLSVLLESLPDDLYSAYLSTDYTLYEQLQIEQMNSSNSVNSLFTYYMNQITAKIHGTTGLECFQIIQLKNVAGLIDGFYCIIGVTDQITTSSFETELKLMLLAPSTVLESRLQT